MKDVFPMKVNTHIITHQAKFAGGQIESIMYPEKFAARQIEPIMYPAKFAGGYSHSIMYPAKFAGGRSRLDLLLPSFLPSREEKKKQDQKNRPLGSRGVLHTPPKHLGRDEQKIQDRKNHPLDSGTEWHTPHMNRVRIETNKQERIFCPLRGHSVGRMQYAPTSCGQETLFPINSREERIEIKMQEQKNRPLGSRGVLHTPHMDRVRIETKIQEQIFCPLWGHVVGRMQYAPTSCREETLFPINYREERIETKMQERRNQSIDSGAEWHMPFMRHGDREAVWREAFLEQRARVAVWRDRRLEEKSSHARLQLRTSGENSKPYKSSLVALSEQLRDIFAA